MLMMFTYLINIITANRYIVKSKIALITKKHRIP